jgi:uncharacterized membrane protein YfcA
LIRGITGFGGAMVMSPPFALLLGPLLAAAAVASVCASFNTVTLGCCVMGSNLSIS